MKKTLYIAPLLILSLFVANYLTNRELVGPETINQGRENTPKSEVKAEETSQGQESDEKLLRFKIDDQSVAVYKVQKRFLSQDDAEVVGESTLITGIGDFNLETNEANLYAQVDLTGLSSDNALRDQHVLELFEPKTVTINYNGKFDDEIYFNQDVITKTTFSININGIKKDVDFDVNYFITEKFGNVKGKGKILMSDFNITAPSLLNVYTVDDEIEIYFDVNLTKN